MGEDGTTDGAHVGLRAVGHGRYVLRQLLGQGGMAAVHLAHDTVLDRPVAVKTLHTDLGRESSFRERFRREAQAVARLSHANIVAVYDSGEDADTDGVTVPYIVMEYIEGTSLSSVLRQEIERHGAMPADRALKVTADVLAALVVSHEHGLVHRDIKPANVMVTPKGDIKVMDFGIARALQSGVTSMTQTGMVVGTPQYLSPEQALGRSVDARADLYSVGCMLFELITGRLPFDGDTAFSIAYKHVQEQPPAPSSVNRAVTPAVDALVARALRKDPAHRFPTAEAMRDEVRRAASGEQGGTTPLVIGGGPSAAHGQGPGGPLSSAVFPQVTGELRTPTPDQVRQPYQPSPAPPFGHGTPPPHAPPPHAPLPHTPLPHTPTPQTPTPQTPPPPYGSPQQRPVQTPPPGFRPQAAAPMPGPMQAPMPQQMPPMQPMQPMQKMPPMQQLRPMQPMQPGQPARMGMPTPPPGAFAPPVPFAPRPPQPSGNGCGTAMVVIGVIVGVLVLIGIIVAIVVTDVEDGTSSTTTDYGYTGMRFPAPPGGPEAIVRLRTGAHTPGHAPGA
ncbi:protein kinase domain-containing protein [Peterkaempfera bronchialis]|uniref:non-specific serine/threonine protein kinase n=1 Tax=Peterkaempfera bronchialis TaxID=2126346 RepID=A0A345SXX1_9ACTN|nr:protein kinase [Peterkaempfera bronchialis]AXI78576.1 serine/threonine protein kinase [Peterkaempfera bronchialis]